MPLKETYFAILDKVKKENPDAMYISVARKTPENAPVDETILALAPSDELVALRKTLDHAEYKKRYLKEIDTKEARLHLQIIRNIALSTDVYLVCWEKSGSFCHRYILLDMLGAKEKTKQTTLF
jgi:uncharacterized protein YeaO (DUF488 family)